MTSEGIEHKIVSWLGQQKVRSLTDVQQQYAAKIGQTLLVLGFFCILATFVVVGNYAQGWRKSSARVAER